MESNWIQSPVPISCGEFSIRSENLELDTSQKNSQNLARPINSFSSVMYTSTHHEKQRIMKSLGSFNPHQSHAWKEIEQHFGTGIVHNEVVSIANVFTTCFQVPAIGRNEKRSFQLLIKWFNEHWGEIEPFLSHIALLKNDEEVPEVPQEWHFPAML
jgi:hypothetical protein